MPKKKKTRVPKNGPVWHRTAEQATLDQMPKYNAHACGTGAHGDAKYNRAKQKRAWQREMDQQGARNRERLSFTAQFLRLPMRLSSRGIWHSANDSTNKAMNHAIDCQMGMFHTWKKG